MNARGCVPKPGVAGVEHWGSSAWARLLQLWSPHEARRATCETPTDCARHGLVHTCPVRCAASAPLGQRA